MRKETAIFVLLMALSGLSFSATLTALNCSHLQVVGAQGTMIDIEWYGPTGWGSVSGVRTIGSFGIYLYPAEFNGTHRLKVGTTPYNLVAMGTTIEVTTCVPPRICADKSDCGAGEMCLNSYCAAGECSSNADCPAAKSCNGAPNYACVAVSCPCGTIVNHACVKFECCSDANCSTGYTCQNNVCTPKPGSGTGTQTDPAKTAAETAISSATSAINAAKSQGKNATEAENLLNQAKGKLASGLYSDAKTLAEQAKSAITSSGTNGNLPGEQGSGSNTDFSLFQSGIGLACIGGTAIFIFAVIVLFLVVALVAAFYKRR